MATDRNRLLTFYDFPAEHWKHIRSTNLIESTFAIVRLRTTKVNAKRAFARLYLSRAHPLDHPCVRRPR